MWLRFEYIWEKEIDLWKKKIQVKIGFYIQKYNINITVIKIVRTNQPNLIVFLHSAVSERPPSKSLSYFGFVDRASYPTS